MLKKNLVNYNYFGSCPRSGVFIHILELFFETLYIIVNHIIDIGRI